jgi:hypothetical protein
LGTGSASLAFHPSAAAIAPSGISQCCPNFIQPEIGIDPRNLYFTAAGGDEADYGANGHAQSLAPMTVASNVILSLSSMYTTNMSAQKE